MAANIRENYGKALEARSDEGFANSLHICVGDTRAIGRLLDGIAESYGSDPGFRGQADLRNSVENIGHINQKFKDLLSR